MSHKQSMAAYAPSEIAYEGFRFLITMKPRNVGMREYIQGLRNHNVRAVVKLCEEDYDTTQLAKSRIALLDLSFPDGKPPPDSIIEAWFNVLEIVKEQDENACVAVHCVSGLGRAAVLVAIALIELGLKYEEAVQTIRQKRRGAINSRQLEFLQKYKRRHRLVNRQKETCIIC